MNNRSKIAPEQWVAEYGDYLYRYALSRLQDETSAQDVVRETFLAEFKGAKKFSGQSSEKTGLIGILKHKVVDDIRKASSERSYEDGTGAEGRVDNDFDRRGHWKTGQPEWRVNPRKTFEQREFWVVFESCLDQLQDRLRSVFTLRELERCAQTEFALHWKSLRRIFGSCSIGLRKG